MAESTHEIETSSEDVEKYCDACKLSGETKLAIVYCETCKQFQCDLCNGMHQKFPVMFGHSIVNVEDKTEEKRDFDMQGIDICENHKEEIKFFCKTENELCCSQCLLNAHLKCGKDGKNGEFTDTNDNKMAELKDIIQVKLFTSAVHQSTIPRVQKELHEDQTHKLQEIDNIKDKVMQLFDTFKAEFISKTDDAINDTRGSLDKEMTACKQLDESMRRTEAFLDDVANKGTPAQVFTGLSVYKKQVDNLETNIRPDQTQLSTLKIELVFHEKLIQFIEMTDEIATVTVQQIDVFTPKKLSVEVNHKLQKNTKDDKMPVYSGLDFLQDGRIVAVDNANNTCVVMDTHMLRLGENVTNERPHDIAVIAENKVAVTHAIGISLYNVNDDNTITQTQTLPTKAQYYSLYAKHDDTLVASTYDCDRPVKMVTLTGEEKDFDLTFPPTSYAFDTSWCTFIPLHAMLVLTDRDANECYLWNVKEKVKRIVTDKRIISPKGVCATQSGLIFVCSEDTKSIVQISPTGQVLGSFRLSHWPECVAVSCDDTHLLVSTLDNDENQLQLLKIT